MSDPGYLPPLGLMRRYLVASGWKPTRLPRGDLDLFVLVAEGSVLEIVLPSTPNTDLPDRMIPALGTLAAVTGADIETVARNVAMLDFDIVRARLPDSSVLRDSVPLRVAEKFLINARRFFTSAAAAEVKRSLFVEDSQKLGSEYANSCRFGHTFRGSFGFTIESQAGPSATQGDAEVSPAPFERRVIERIATGLPAVENAARTGRSEVLEQQAGNGFNVNMLEDFTSLIADSSASKLSFDFTLTPQWRPRAGLQLTTEISQEALPLMDKAASALRPPVVPARETIVGQVIMLATRENPADLLQEGAREVAIDGVSVQRGQLTVRVRLSPADYLIAFGAHGTGKAVSVAGFVTRSSRGNVLNSPTGFREV